MIDQRFGPWGLLQDNDQITIAVLSSIDSGLFVGNSPSANTRSGAKRTLGAITALGALAAPLVAASTIH